MKAIKMIGLTALVALMAMAFVGASSAMAESTALCDEDPVGTEVCPSGHLLGAIHEESVGKAKLVTSVGTTECNVLFGGTISTKLANPLLVVGTFVYTNCVLGSTNCTATEENGPSTIEVLKEGHETSKVTGKGLVFVDCGSFLKCSYNGTGLKGVGKGPLLSAQTNGDVTLTSQVTTKEGGFLCPKESKLTITTTPLTPTYIKS
ncbi:MAG: hypothetical protein ACJ75S_07625 [Solirubrobacterales bacterium]